ncbi:MAG: hypothetical protein Q9227_004677 [Pyrenula ochraceoflavens]
MHFFLFLASLITSVAARTSFVNVRQAVSDPSNANLGILVSEFGGLNHSAGITGDGSPQYAILDAGHTGSVPAVVSWGTSDGRVRSGDPYGDAIWFIVPSSTGVIDITNDLLGNGASDGFTYDAGGLKYQGSSTVFWACNGATPVSAPAGNYLLVIEIDGVEPEADWDCLNVPLTGTLPAK